MGINLKKQRKKLQRTVAMSANVVPTPDMLRRSHPVDVHEPLLKKRRRPQRRDLNSDKWKRYRTTVFSLFFLSSDTLHNIILFPVNAMV